MRGALTQYIDVAQVVLYVFWAFFAGLIFYLRREDKREGYPLDSDRAGGVMVQGWPGIPAPKIFKLPHGGTAQAPRRSEAQRDIRAVTAAPWPGAPLVPAGDPLVDAIGPASYAERADVVDLTWEGAPKIVPLRVATGFYPEPRDPDPRGFSVVAADGAVVGRVTDLWLDRSEYTVRYFELEVAGAGIPRRTIVPVNFARIDAANRRVVVKALVGAQFANVPGLRNPDQVTLREEDRISAYYGGGLLYATPLRAEPLL